jgi:carboxymethylenebutenolidase
MNNVSETIVKIPVEGGEMSAFLATPSESRGKSVVMLQEIFGVNEAMRSKARQFAKEGFTVLVPDLFWRIQPNVELGYDDAARAEAFKFFKAFDFAKGVSDIKAAFDFLSRRAESVGAPSLVGFCLGGKLAVLAGTAEPRARSVISFYGVALDQNIEQLKAMKMPVVLHFGTNDAHIPNEVSSAIAYALKESAYVHVYLYQGAQHGFFNHMRSDAFDFDAADSAFDRTVKVLRQ